MGDKFSLHGDYLLMVSVWPITFRTWPMDRATRMPSIAAASRTLIDSPKGKTARTGPRFH
jgi:hypothetical protein